MKNNQSINMYFIGIALLSNSFGEVSALGAGIDGDYPSQSASVTSYSSSALYTETASTKSLLASGNEARGGLPIFNKADKDGALGGDIAYNFMKNAVVDQSKKNAAFYAPGTNSPIRSSPRSNSVPGTKSEPSIEGQTAPSDLIVSSDLIAPPDQAAATSGNLSGPEVDQHLSTPSDLTIQDSNTSGLGSNPSNMSSGVVADGSQSTGANLSTMGVQSIDSIENSQASYASGTQDQIRTVQTDDFGTFLREIEDASASFASNSNVSGVLLSLILLLL